MFVCVIIMSYPVLSCHATLIITTTRGGTDNGGVGEMACIIYDIWDGDKIGL